MWLVDFIPGSMSDKVMAVHRVDDDERMCGKTDKCFLRVWLELARIEQDMPGFPCGGALEHGKEGPVGNDKQLA